MENLLPLFIAVTAAAVLLQAGVLVGLYIAMRKSSARMEAIAQEVKSKIVPTLDTTQAMIAELRPQLATLAENLAEITTTLRTQVQRIDATVNDIIDRSRLQVIRADELLTRTLDRVEETTEVVQKTVVSPVRQFAGLIQGISAGVEFFFASRGRRNGGSRENRRAVPQDEMFI
jgi:methyl-accepting chemotaxis protein